MISLKYLTIHLHFLFVLKLLLQNLLYELILLIRLFLKLSKIIWNKKILYASVPISVPKVKEWIDPTIYNYLAILLDPVTAIIGLGGFSFDIFNAVDPVEVNTIINLALIL